MPFDQSRIGVLAAELMDDLEERVAEGEIGAIALVVEVIEADGGFGVATKFSDPRKHVNLGLLEIGRRQLGD